MNPTDVTDRKGFIGGSDWGNILQSERGNTRGGKLGAL